MAAVRAFRDYDDNHQPSEAYNGRYALLWSFYTGLWLNDPRFVQIGPELYQNARLIWKQSDAIVSLYNQFVYAGDLSTNGKPLPDGTRGAIPIDPQTPGEADQEAQLLAFHELFNMWQYRQMMSLRPKLGSVLGNVLTELVDDQAAGVVMPNTVWPGFVPDRDLELGPNGDVKQYAIEYDVVIEGREAFGRRIEADNYRYRKEVTPEEFRYYKNGRPFAYPDHGLAVQRNPYGFCPAIWDRHEITFGNQGTAAIEKSLLSTMQLNSLFSQAMDYAGKHLAAPVGVTGSSMGSRVSKRLTMPKAAVSALTGNYDAEEELANRQAAEDLNLLYLGENGGFVNVPFDLGQTKEMMELLISGMMRENPEAEFGSRLLELSQATGPGVDRILSPITGKVRDARKNYDPQTIKLLQMGTSMMAHNLTRNFWSSEVVLRRQARYKPFARYTLDSYWAGLLDCSIPDRPVFQESLDERIARLTQINLLMGSADPWILEQAGVPPEEIDRIVQKKEEEQAALDAALTGIPPAGGPPAQRSRNQAQKSSN